MRLSRFLPAILTLAGVAACTGHDLASPSRLIDGPTAAASRHSLPGSRAYLTSAGSRGTFVRCVTPAAEGKAVIGPAGGELQIGRHRLIVPAGSIPHPVEISGYMPADTTITIWLEPHGITFQKPVGLQLDVSDCEFVPDVIYVSDVSEGASEYIRAEYSALWKTVAAPLRHFSGYAIAFRDPSCDEPAGPDGSAPDCGSGPR